LALVPQVLGEAGDGLIGDGVEAVEDDSKIASQRLFVIGFEFSLGGGNLAPSGL